MPLRSSEFDFGSEADLDEEHISDSELNLDEEQFYDSEADLEEEHIQVCLPADMEGFRLDKAASAYLENESRSYIKKLLKDGNILLNGNPAKPSANVHGGDVIDIHMPAKTELAIEAQDIPLDILYEDKDVLVVNKPKGMVVHPAAGHYRDTLVNAVMFHCGDELSGINGVLRPGIVHRIDKDTTGSIIICKNDIAHKSIADQLFEHSIRRVYYAIVYGNIKEDDIVINAPIGRDPKDRKKMAVVPRGKHAVTHCHVLERFGDYTYVECILETGRTHQIRVHLSTKGHPLLGDPLYSGKRKSPFKTDGQCLHAGVLGFIHPVTGEYIETTAPLPDYFIDILAKLRAKYGH